MNSRITNQLHQLLSNGSFESKSVTAGTSVMLFDNNLLANTKFITIQASEDIIYKCDSTPVVNSSGFTLLATTLLTVPVMDFKKMYIYTTSNATIAMQQKHE